MKPRSAKKAFLKHIKNAGHLLKALVPSEGVDLMLNFYREVKAEGCRIEEDGDMLLYQWGTYDWGKGESFEFDITRQLIVGDGEDEGISQLSLTFKFPPTVPLRALGDGNRWCRSPEDVEEFRSFICDSPAFLAVGQDAPFEVQLEYGVAG